MQNQLRREAVSPKGLLVRLDHAAGTMNAFLLVFAIGLAALDLTCLWILTVRDAVPSVTRLSANPGMASKAAVPAGNTSAAVTPARPGDTMTGF